MVFKKRISLTHWRLILPAFLLSCFGLLSIFSSSLSRGDFFNFEKQLVAIVISLLIAIMISFVDLRFLKANSYLIFSLYILSLLSLGGLLLIGGHTRGIQGWYKIGAISIDPEPFVAIILIIVLSKYFFKPSCGNSYVKVSVFFWYVCSCANWLCFIPARFRFFFNLNGNLAWNDFIFWH